MKRILTFAAVAALATATIPVSAERVDLGDGYYVDWETVDAEVVEFDEVVQTEEVIYAPVKPVDNWIHWSHVINCPGTPSVENTPETDNEPELQFYPPAGSDVPEGTFAPEIPVVGPGFEEYVGNVLDDLFGVIDNIPTHDNGGNPFNVPVEHPLFGLPGFDEGVDDFFDEIVESDHPLADLLGMVTNHGADDIFEEVANSDHPLSGFIATFYDIGVDEVFEDVINSDHPLSGVLSTVTGIGAGEAVDAVIDEDHPLSGFPLPGYIPMGSSSNDEQSDGSVLDGIGDVLNSVVDGFSNFLGGFDQIFSIDFGSDGWN